MSTATLEAPAKTFSSYREDAMASFAEAINCKYAVMGSGPITWQNPKGQLRCFAIRPVHRLYDNSDTYQVAIIEVNIKKTSLGYMGHSLDRGAQELGMRDGFDFRKEFVSEKKQAFLDTLPEDDRRFVKTVEEQDRRRAMEAGWVREAQAYVESHPEEFYRGGERSGHYQSPRLTLRCTVEELPAFVTWTAKTIQALDENKTPPKPPSPVKGLNFTGEMCVTDDALRWLVSAMTNEEMDKIFNG